jgi:sulfate transport system permease protein
MPLRWRCCSRTSTARAAFALASVLTMLAVVTLLLKVWVEGRVRGHKTEDRGQEETKTPVVSSAAFRPPPSVL